MFTEQSCQCNEFVGKTIRMINIIIFGPPGSGKGTQAKILKEKFELLHISTGDLFRYEIGNSTPLGLEAKSYIDRGALVPDSVTIGMLKNKVNANSDAKGIIYDGFPRNVHQAEALDDFLKEKERAVDVLIELLVEDEETVKRILKRGETSGRSDDSDPAIIRNRLKIYHSETSMVYNYYNYKGKSKKVDGMGEIEEVTARLTAIIEAL